MSSPKSTTVDVVVNVLDINDNDPVFPPAGYSVTIKEGEGRREVIKVAVIFFNIVAHLHYLISLSSIGLLIWLLFE